MARTGRPRVTVRAEHVTLRLKPDTIDLIHHHAYLRGENPSTLIRRVLERTFRVLKSQQPETPCYARPQSSTLSYVLGSETPADTLESVAAPPQTALGRRESSDVSFR